MLNGLKEDIETKGLAKRNSYKFGVTVFPTRMLVNENGIIIEYWEGDSKENTDNFKDHLKKVIAE